jgi:hypothetical protein
MVIFALFLLFKGSPIYSIPLSPSPSGEGWDEVLRENT